MQSARGLRGCLCFLWKYTRVLQSCRERKLNTNFFVSNFVGTSGISRQNPGISRQKSMISLVSRDIPNFLAPTPSRGRPLPKRKISGLKSLGLGSFFVPDFKARKPQRTRICYPTEPLILAGEDRRRTNVQQLTCNIDLSRSFYCLFFSFVLIEPKPFVLKESPGGKNDEKVWENCEKVWKFWNDFAL